jgi:hypothetical protein
MAIGDLASRRRAHGPSSGGGQGSFLTMVVVVCAISSEWAHQPNSAATGKCPTNERSQMSSVTIEVARPSALLMGADRGVVGRVCRGLR